MSIFIVIIDGESSAVKNRLDKHYPDNYPYHRDEQIVLVRSNDIAEKIAVNVGIKGENKVEDASGAVFKMNPSYAGYTSNALWDWLRKSGE